VPFDQEVNMSSWWTSEMANMLMKAIGTGAILLFVV
jgi:hypothetical protein